jgi:hypothetical protein
MNVPVKHHFVPEFYLEPWCDGTAKLTVYSRVRGNKIYCKKMSPAGTAYKLHLNTLTGVSPERQGDFETKFMTQQVDDPAAIVFGKLVKGDCNLSHLEHLSMTRFIHSLTFRYPTVLEKIKSIAPEKMKQELEKNPLSYSELIAIVPENNHHLSLYELCEKYFPIQFKNLGLHLTEKIIKSESREQQYYNMNWIVRDVSDSSGTLFTSDRPVWFEKMNEFDNEFVALPISPTRILMGFGKKSQAPSKVKLISSDIIIDWMNDLVVRRADKYCYHTNSDKSDFVRSRLKTLGEH